MAEQTTMRAMVLVKRGKASEAYEFHADWPVPKRGPKQVLVKIAATALCAGDWKMRSGIVPIPLKLPKIMGEDIAGVVVEAPEGSKFKKGDRVFGSTGQVLKSGHQGGSACEFTAADEDTLWHIPDGVSFLDAASVCIGLTAWQALEPVLPLQGKRVLIHGGAGGVGGFAVQIAKAHGAHVTTTCSTRNVEFVTKTLGADEAIDYTQGPWEKKVSEPFDFILDLIGGSYQAASFRVLKRGGKLAVVGATGPGKHGASLPEFIGIMLGALWRTALGALRLGPRYHFVMMECKAAKGLAQMSELMAQGKLRVHLDKVFPLEELAAAHEYAETGHVRGKVGILVNEL